MGKRKSAKRKKLAMNEVNLNGMKDPPKWEDLMPIRETVCNSLVEQNTCTIELFNKTRPYLEQKPELNEAVKGLIISYSDIAESVSQNMARHITRNEKNEIVDFKKGAVNLENNDIMDYFNIASQYMMAQEQIAHLSHKGHTEIFSILALSIDDNKELLDSIAEMNEEYEKNVGKLAEIAKEEMSKIYTDTSLKKK